MHVIKTTDSLAKFCKAAASSPYVAVDTEFMRERTFYSQLCLVQAATPTDEVIIDPLADGIDLAPLNALMLDKNIVKVLHAARQDLEIFYMLCGAVPSPLFDTQIAAMALGFGENIGYTNLVKGRLGISLDKGARFTDWSRRPLSEKQLSYALADVTHLRDLYPNMAGELRERGRSSWVEEEMRPLSNPDLYSFEAENAWKRLKPRKFSHKYLAVMRAAAAWRERQAQTINIPRNRVLKDDGIYDLAQRPPKTAKELASLRGIPSGFENRKGAKYLLAAIKDALDNAASYAPQISAPQSLPKGTGPVADILRTLLRANADKHNIAPRMIANSTDLDHIAAFGEDANVSALTGWRREVFGEDALAMIKGKLALKIKDGTVVLTPT